MKLPNSLKQAFVDAAVVIGCPVAIANDPTSVLNWLIAGGLFVAGWFAVRQLALQAQKDEE